MIQRKEPGRESLSCLGPYLARVLENTAGNNVDVLDAQGSQGPDARPGQLEARKVRLVATIDQRDLRRHGESRDSLLDCRVMNFAPCMGDACILHIDSETLNVAKLDARAVARLISKPAAEGLRPAQDAVDRVLGQGLLRFRVRGRIQLALELNTLTDTERLKERTLVEFAIGS